VPIRNDLDAASLPSKREKITFPCGCMLRKERQGFKRVVDSLRRNVPHPAATIRSELPGKFLHSTETKFEV
jgi:hypothetical protein